MVCAHGKSDPQMVFAVSDSAQSHVFICDTMRFSFPDMVSIRSEMVLIGGAWYCELDTPCQVSITTMPSQNKHGGRSFAENGMRSPT